jgi:glycosyltransferase involved in cell wall biosynthesis
LHEGASTSPISGDRLAAGLVSLRQRLFLWLDGGAPTSGVRTAVAHLAVGLPSLGIECTVFVSPRPGDWGAWERDIPCQLVAVSEGGVASWALGRSLGSAAPRRGDVVACDATRASRLLAHAAAPRGARPIVVLHNDCDPDYQSACLVARSFSGAPVLAVSRAIADEVVARAEAIGVPLGPVSVVPYGVDPVPAKQGPRPDGCALKALYLGRLDAWQKRTERLIAVASECTRRGIFLDLDIVGDGPQEPDLRRLIRDAGLEDRVRLPGRWSAEEIKERLGLYDVLLLVSDFEGFPLAVLEAMSAAVVPVVGRTRSGLADLIQDGVCGRLVADTADIGGYVTALGELAREREMLTRLGAAASRLVREDYSVARMCSGWAGVLTQVGGSTWSPWTLPGREMASAVVACAGALLRSSWPSMRGHGSRGSDARA